MAHVHHVLLTYLQGIHKTNNTAENTRMHEYIYLKTTKLYILLLLTGVNNVYQATLLFLHYRVTKTNCMLCLGELWHCTSPGLRLASHRCLPRALTSGVLCQRTGARPIGEKPAWLQNPSSHSSPQQEGCISIQGYHTWGHSPGASSALPVVQLFLP